MKDNSFFKLAELLPIEVVKRNGAVVYKFHKTPNREECIWLLENEMPGVLVGDDFNEKPDLEEIISVFNEGEKFTIYSGSFYDGEGDTAEVWIEEKAIANNLFELYKSLFELRNSVLARQLRAIKISTPEELFFNYFNENGCTEINREEYFEDDGSGKTLIFFEKDGNEFSIVYPENDYYPDGFEFHNISGTSDGFTPNWSDFINALLKEDIESYDGFSDLGE